jgi:hypothetical protein
MGGPPNKGTKADKRLKGNKNTTPPTQQKPPMPPKKGK